MRLHPICLFPVAATLVLLGADFGCSAGGGAAFGDGASGQGNTGQGATGTGGDIMFGGQGGGTTQACQDPSCIGNTPQGNCDSALPIDSALGMDGARAIGLCQVAAPGTWGVVSADWVKSDGSPLVGGDDGDLTLGKGILADFGNVIVPREGSKVLALSSGAARDPGDPGFQDPAGYQKDSSPHVPPPGYPKESPSCPGVETGDPYDSAGLRMVIRTPADAKSFTFDFTFYTYEYPDYICSMFNDFFVAMLTPKLSTLPDGNISFDEQQNTISVNAGFLEACNPCNAGGKNFACSLGYGEILGTGFESNQSFQYMIQGSASTSWLITTAPVDAPGSEITLQFAIWDSGDEVLDSTVIIDNFKFALGEGQVGTQPIPR
jgi:hypothetical protein